MPTAVLIEFDVIFLVMKTIEQFASGACSGITRKFHEFSQMLSHSQQVSLLASGMPQRAEKFGLGEEAKRFELDRFGKSRWGHEKAPTTCGSGVGMRGSGDFDIVSAPAFGGTSLCSASRDARPRQLVVPAEKFYFVEFVHR